MLKEKRAAEMQRASSLTRKLHATTELLGDHDQKEQKLNFPLSGFTRELFNFTVCGKMTMLATKTGTKVIACVCVCECVCGRVCQRAQGSTNV